MVDTSDAAREKMNELMARLDDAPTLEKIAFSYTTLKLADLEELHRRVPPTLNAVKLDTVFIYIEDTVSLKDFTAVQTVKSLSITFANIRPDLD